MAFNPWNEFELKKKFAEGLLRNPSANCYALACALVGNCPDAYAIANVWPTDNVVLDIKSKLIAEFGEEYFLPSRADLAKMIIGFVDEKTADGNAPRHSSKERIAAMDLYARVMGFIEKPMPGRQASDKTSSVVFEVAPYADEPSSS